MGRDAARARRSLSAARELLAAHWAGEEDGVFAVMAESDRDYAGYVDVLVGEHREQAVLLAADVLGQGRDPRA